MDDLGIHIQGDLALHHECTRCVLLHLKEHSLSLKLSTGKCIFNAPHIEFPSMIIGQGKIEMDAVKLLTIKEWKPPASVKGFCSFFGGCELLLQIHPRFLSCCCPAQPPHQERPILGLDLSSTMSIRNT